MAQDVQLAVIPPEDAGADDRQVYEEHHMALPLRVMRTVAIFSRRKPLGALGGFLVLVMVLMAIFGSDTNIGPVKIHSLAPYKYNEYRVGREKLQAPSGSHIMGTDDLGRDIFSRLLYGARLSLIIGLGVLAIGTTLSTTLTILSAYYLNSLDLVLQRLVEVWSALPELVVLIALFSIYGATPLTLILTVGVFNGLTTSRVLRSLVISARSTEYVSAARAIGATDSRIMFRHIFPNVAFYIIVSATGAVAAAIIFEAGLAIIGFGVSPVYPTWGNMINASRDYLRVAPHMVIFPAMMLALAIFGFRLLGDALRDVLDPRLRGTGR